MDDMRDISMTANAYVKTQIDVDGLDELKAIGSTLDQIARGTNLNEYWMTQEQLIQRVSNAFKTYKNNMTQANGGELVKSFNALEATGANINEIFSGIDMSGTVKNVVEQMGEMGKLINAQFSPNNFKNAFESLEALKNAGVSEDFLKGLGANTDVQSLINQIEGLSDALAVAKAREEELEKALADSESGNGVTRLKEEIKELQQELSSLTSKANQEFSSFLNTNDISLDDARVQEYFERISDGTMTAKEAIANFKVEYSGLMSEKSSGLDTSQLEAFMTKLESIYAKVEEIHTKLSTGDFSMGGVTDNTFKIEETAQALTDLAKATDGVEGGATSTNGAMSLIKSLSELGNINLDNLLSLEGSIKGLNKLNGITVSKASMNNLVTGLTSLAAIPDLHKLSAISTLNFDGFNNLKVSKASLNNMATFLPTIAGVNVDPIKQLASINFDNLNNLTVSKSAVSNLSELTKATSGSTLNVDSGLLASLNGIATALEKIAPAFAEVKSGMSETGNAGEQMAVGVENAENKVQQFVTSATSGFQKVKTARQEAFDSEGKSTSVVSTVEELNKATGEMRKTVTSDDGSQVVTTTNNIAAAAKSAADAERELASAAATANKNLASAQSTVNSKTSAADNLLNSYKNAKGSSVDTATYNANIKAVNEYKKAISDAFAELQKTQATDPTAFTKFSTEITKAGTAFKEAETSMKSYVSEAKKADSLLNQGKKTYTSLSKTINDYSKAQTSLKDGSKEAYANLKEQQTELKNLNESYEQGSIAAEEYAKSYKSIQDSITNSKNVIINNKDNSTSIFDRIGNLATKFSTWFGVSQVIMYAVNSMREMVSQSIELDSAMTQLKIVTDETDQTYQSFASDAASAAQQLGVSITDLVDATTTYARLGYDLDESFDLSKLTTQLQAVGDIEASDAQNAMTSIIKSFNIDTTDIESTMDKLVTVGKISCPTLW